MRENGVRERKWSTLVKIVTGGVDSLILHYIFSKIHVVVKTFCDNTVNFVLLRQCVCVCVSGVYYGVTNFCRELLSYM